MPVNMNRVMRSSSISIVNGRRVETINETIHGVTRQQTIVSDLNNGPHCFIKKTHKKNIIISIF
mgnify:CR=1 FL=1